ncbi:multifunctional CCA addition/repair protein [Catenovulum adriaticum]|uniref:Multifunctional CCA protein n=1 Tax=Catenovulum adriaticum TaxID=2984846 RepID=A0ABY7AK52_9ALTE|nr:multifunctional CCA addition/repair protein [Catenovulum sp. TS8]WAJ69132.1 multifunctional CCA addition/repair protein [Catenovulum sp. TS8]
MKIYLVGGAVRDQLLNLPVKDQDWVVVGSHTKAMLEMGYQQVGQDFPVFLHPKTKQEYALARTEKKQGDGYLGFICQADETVSLEEDLQRRDLTINAIAQDQSGHYVDPYHGKADLEKRILRHVSPAFVEDPLRVLRVARFAARFYHLGFTIADETLDLMQQIAQSQQLDYLTPERIWLETEKALSTQNPQIYFEVLRQVGALNCFLPELDQLWGIPNPKKWHPEIDSGVHTMMALKTASRLSDDLAIRFAALSHDFGKAATPQAKWPSHPGHGDAGIAIIEAVCKRLKVPNNCKDLAKIVSAFHNKIHKLDGLSADEIVTLLDKIDAWRKPERFKAFLICCQADFQGRLNFNDKPYPQKSAIENYYAICKNITAQPFVESGIKGAQIKQAMFDARVDAVKKSQQKN